MISQNEAAKIFGAGFKVGATENDSSVTLTIAGVTIKLDKNKNKSQSSKGSTSILR